MNLLFPTRVLGLILPVMPIRTCLLFVILFCFSCNNKKSDKVTAGKIEFDKAKWSIKEGEVYPYRKEMLDDLIANHLVHGLKYNEVLDMLGQPTKTDTGYLFYRISRKSSGIVTLNVKTLVVKFTKDSTLEWRKIHG
jgi:hypothetical protein